MIASVAAVLCISLPQAPAQAIDIPHQALSFVVLANGDPIGSHEIRFRQEGPDLHVMSEADLSFKLGPIELFSYEHKSHEIWRNGQLIHLETTTDDDGDLFWVKGQAAEEGFKIESSLGDHIAPTGSMPASYWHPGVIKGGALIDMQDGTLFDYPTRLIGKDLIQREGETIEALRYQRDDDRNLQLWYDEEGILSQSSFKAHGMLVEYLWNDGGAPVYQARRNSLLRDPAADR